MITISLDEAGKFEKTSEDKQGKSKDSRTTLIGGILFDDCDVPGEFETEQKRIEAYYNAVIDKSSADNPDMKFSYPNDLHSRNGKNNRRVAVVKDNVSKTLTEFLRVGTFGGAELEVDGEVLPSRNGSYRICAVVKSAKGKSALLNNELGNFFSDDAASNLYYHMASEAVEHFIFHNPVFPDIEKVNLDIATRQSGLLSEEDAKVYDQIGITQNSRDDLDEGVKQYSIMNADVFRTILTEQMLSERKKNIVIESCRVRPISYYNNKKNKDQVFLYLADSVCSFLTWNIGDDDVSEVKRLSQKLINMKNLIFAYDEVDLYFKRAWQDMEVGEYYDALKELYSISVIDSDEAKLYREYWSSYIKNQIIDKTRAAVLEGRIPDEIAEAISELRAVIMSNGLKPNEAEYIFGVIKQAVVGMEDNTRYFGILYAVNEIGLALSNHVGNLTVANSYFVNCEKYAGGANIEEYVRSRNRYTNALMDSFDYESALGILRVTLELIYGVYEVSRKTFGTKYQFHFGAIELAKTYSQLGQICSFLKDEEALDYYNWAIKHFEDDLPNKRITLSYKLHYLIEKGDKEAFKEAMLEYNEGFSTVENQIKTLSMMGNRRDININYAFYLYLKGLYTFYSDADILAVWDSIKNLESNIDKRDKGFHPWELIYKYLSLLALRMNDKKLAKQYQEKIVACVGDRKGSIVTAIALFGEAQVIEATKDNALAENKYTALYNRLEEEFELFNPDKLTNAKFEDKKAFMENRFTFMYT